MPPSDAINCIYRGRQLIVAGDDKQLPPTSFFSTGGSDEESDEKGFDDFQSVLDLCKGSGALPSLPLSWHYRSDHESLIAFSNYSFYGGKLHTFPDPRGDQRSRVPSRQSRTPLGHAQRLPRT